LEKYGWRDWYQSAEEELTALVARTSSVIAVGLSLGSLLVLRLAYACPKKVSGLVLLSPALVLRNPWPERLAFLAALTWPWLPEGYGHWHKGESDIADQAARRRHPSYKTMPLRSIVELVHLQREVRGLLPAVRQPALVIQGRQDHTAPLENMAILQRQLPNLRGTVILPESYHVVTVDLDKEHLVEEVIRFVDRVVDERLAPARR
jgi:carboxylesterase